MITSAQYSVDGTAVKIAPTGEGYRDVYVHQDAGSVYINGSNAVTTSTGFLVEKAAGPVTIRIGPQDELWAISGATHTLSVLIVGV